MEGPSENNMVENKAIRVKKLDTPITATATDRDCSDSKFYFEAEDENSLKLCQPCALT